MKFQTTLLALAISLAGGAAYSSDPANQAIYHAEHAQEELLKGESEKEIFDVIRAIELPGGPARLASMFEQDANLRFKFIEAVGQQIDRIGGVQDAKKWNQLLVQINKGNVLNYADLSALIEKYKKIVDAGNKSDRLPFLLDRDTLSLYGLSSPEQSQKIFERTLRTYEDASFAWRDMDAVLYFVHASGPGSAVEKRFIERLPQLNIRESELALIQSIAPEFAAKRKAEITFDADLNVTNVDRPFADDLVSSLGKSIDGLVWRSAPDNDAVEVVVERVRYSGKNMAPAMRTVTYSYEQVDSLAAARSMSKSWSYQFDLRTKGAEIEYGYVVSAYRAGRKLSESVVRGKVGGESRKCENARVITVFGSIPASFTANADMRKACSGPSSVSMDDLRGQILEKITAEVRSIPEIEAYMR